MKRLRAEATKESVASSCTMFTCRIHSPQTVSQREYKEWPLCSDLCNGERNFRQTDPWTDRYQNDIASDPKYDGYSDTEKG
jgi:hypothetical protein